MTTRRTQSRVSFAAVLTAVLTLTGCAATTSQLSHFETGALDSAPLPAAPEATAAAEVASATIQFDNQADGAVRVYLVDEQRQWLLGRVERGANAALRIPGTALAAPSRWMRLSIVPSEPATARATDLRPATMSTEPVAAIISQRWTFARTLGGGELTSLPVTRAAAPPQ